MATHDVPVLESDAAARAIAMAVVLFASIAAGMLLTIGRHAGLDEPPKEELAKLTEAVSPVEHAEVFPDPALCHEFVKDVQIVGKLETIYGTTCQQPDGTWDVVR